VHKMTVIVTDGFRDSITPTKRVATRFTRGPTLLYFEIKCIPFTW
jgi:hypothetical protein